MLPQGEFGATMEGHTTIGRGSEISRERCLGIGEAVGPPESSVESVEMAVRSPERLVVYGHFVGLCCHLEEI